MKLNHISNTDFHLTLGVFAINTRVIQTKINISIMLGAGEGFSHRVIKI